MTMKNIFFWDIKTPFVPHRRHITSLLQSPASLVYVRFEVCTAMAMKNTDVWYVVPCGFVALRSVLQLLVTANVVPSLLNFHHVD
jgi:hypothetical protein